jgi:hypothetical protein
VVIIRELKALAGGEDEAVGAEHIKRYLAARPRGLTRSGIYYWLVQRASALAGTVLGGKPLPLVDDADPEIGLPNHIEV